jgi:hypothetical protein
MSFLEGTDCLQSRNTPGTDWSVRKELIMSTVTDPPSDERKIAGARRRAKGFGRKLVNRRSLIAAFHIVYWTVRIAKLLRQMFDDL